MLFYQMVNNGNDVLWFKFEVWKILTMEETDTANKVTTINKEGYFVFVHTSPETQKACNRGHSLTI